MLPHDDPGLVGRLRDRLRTRLGDAAPDADALAPVLAGLLTTARGAWPALVVDPCAFVDHVADRLPTDAPALTALAAARAADLYLACACARGDEVALAAFDAAYGADLRRAAGRERAVPADDLLQLLRQRLFTGPTPRIADYAGQGDLRSWLRVAALRLVVDVARKRTEAPTAEAEGPWLAMPDTADDPELAYLKRHYRHEFQAAFERAVTALAPEERNVLRWHYAQGLSVDEIAAVHNVHRATAARRVVRARDALLAETRRLLTERLRLDARDLDSVMRLIESQVHVSVQRLFCTGDER